MWHVMNSLSGVILGEKFKIDGVIQEVKSNLKSG
jgi:hypothetical protein